MSPSESSNSELSNGNASSSSPRHRHHHQCRRCYRYRLDQCRNLGFIEGEGIILISTPSLSSSESAGLNAITISVHEGRTGIIRVVVVRVLTLASRPRQHRSALRGSNGKSSSSSRTPSPSSSVSAVPMPSPSVSKFSSGSNGNASSVSEPHHHHRPRRYCRQYHHRPNRVFLSHKRERIVVIVNAITITIVITIIANTVLSVSLTSLGLRSNVVAIDTVIVIGISVVADAV